jgi:hypothetical protein
MFGCELLLVSIWLRWSFSFTRPLRHRAGGGGSLPLSRSGGLSFHVRRGFRVGVAEERNPGYKPNVFLLEGFKLNA